MTIPLHLEVSLVQGGHLSEPTGFRVGNMEGRLGTWGCPQDQYRLYLLSQGLLTVPPATSNLARDSSQGEPMWALMSSELEHYQLPAMDQQQVSRLLRASVSSPVRQGEC